MKESFLLPTAKDLRASQVSKELILAHRHLGELKGISHILPNKKILLATLTLSEAKDSSAIENIITTQDSLYRDQILPSHQNIANKEVLGYFKALEIGQKLVQDQGGISCNTIIEIQSFIDPKRPGLRKLPGTTLKNMATNEVIYTPPSPDKIPALMAQFEQFINSNSMDPLIKMVIAHHLFESIHPFYDGNGRTGRIINILYLLSHDLLEDPILYLSRYILRHKSDYYRLLQKVREEKAWTEWITYMLRGIATISQETKELIKKIDCLFRKHKQIIRSHHKFYSHELINHIFSLPYTKAKLLEQELGVSRTTAARYLNALVQSGILEKRKLGQEDYYVNKKLFEILQES